MHTAARVAELGADTWRRVAELAKDEEVALRAFQALRISEYSKSVEFCRSGFRADEVLYLGFVGALGDKA